MAQLFQRLSLVEIRVRFAFLTPFLPQGFSLVAILLIERVGKLSLVHAAEGHLRAAHLFIFTRGVLVVSKELLSGDGRVENEPFAPPRRLWLLDPGTVGVGFSKVLPHY